MSDIPSGEGNPIVPPSREAVSFPMLIFAALVVGAGIYVVSEITPAGGWLLAFLVLLIVAFSYRDFGNEIVQLFSGVAPNQQPMTWTDIPNVMPPVVGPMGPLSPEEHLKKVAEQ